MTSFATYQPECKVTLIKNVERTAGVSARFAGTNPKIDLTPFIGDGASVRTSKSVRDPAGGFSVTLMDKPYVQDGSFESLYGLIEPMDSIEIRMRQSSPSLFMDSPGNVPIVMRGFVSDVTRSETMGEDGRPQRSVTVTGQDYGKIWQLMQILYFPYNVLGQEVLSNFALFERFGINLKNVTDASGFVALVLDKIINPYLSRFIGSSQSAPRRIDLDLSVGSGVVGIDGPQKAEGTLYDLLHRFGDVGPWNELFIEDREDGVFCVYRPNPYYHVTDDANGTFKKGDLIFPDSEQAPPATVDLLDEDLVSINVSRTDGGVANFYWVRSPRFELVSEVMNQLTALAAVDRTSIDLATYPNSRSDLYGLRVMMQDTQQGGNDVKSFASGQEASDTVTRDTSMVNWVKNRRALLVLQNRDNVLLESGTMRIRGNEAIKPGVWVMLKRGSFTARYYVVSVDREFVPFQGMFATLRVERGEGFVERIGKGGGAQSPYLQERVSNGR